MNKTIIFQYPLQKCFSSLKWTHLLCSLNLIIRLNDFVPHRASQHTNYIFIKVLDVLFNICTMNGWDNSKSIKSNKCPFINTSPPDPQCVWPHTSLPFLASMATPTGTFHSQILSLSGHAILVQCYIELFSQLWHIKLFWGLAHNSFCGRTMT